jgi:hypothetical protein
MVYWSDVREQSIHRSTLDGSNSIIFLDKSDNVGIVDGKSHHDRVRSATVLCAM